jgi:hypothetical protein
MLTGIEKGSERLEKGNYYAKLYHESNFPDIQEYNIICIHNNKQVAFELNGERKFVHNIKCRPYSKNYYKVQIANVRTEVNDFLFLFIRDPYKYYDKPIMPQKLNIACRSLLGRKQDLMNLANLNIVPIEVNETVCPGVWILDNPPGQYFMPSINIDIRKKKKLCLVYKGRSNTNICLIPIINYRQANIKINDKILPCIELPYMQKDGGLINFELAEDLPDNPIFFVIAIEKPVNNNLAESVKVSNRTIIQSR